MRLDGRNLYVTRAELDRISELKYDDEALAKYLGPDACAAIQREVGCVPIVFWTPSLPGGAGSAA